MNLQTFQYVIDKGWSVKEFPNLDSENTLILIFAAPEFIHHPGPIQELAKYYPQSKIIGCSSAGEIAGAHILDKSMSVAIAQFTKTPIKTISMKIDDVAQSAHVGEKIATLLNKEDLRGIFVLSDGLKINGSELAKGLNTINKNDVVITGGLAGDGSQFKQTWTVYNGDIIDDNIVAVGFYGDHVHISHGSRGGWDIFGPERRITRSENNILYELDGKPALALYKEYLGEKAAGLPATGLLFPLSIRKDIFDAKQLVRTILAVDEKTQSLTFAGDVPTGYMAQLMRANFDRLVDGASEASRLTMEQHPGLAASNPLLLIAISCVGRRLLLGERTEEETESTLDIFPKGTQQVGFYSYGELSPLIEGTCDLHNQTMTLTSITEEV
jgi:hypothetical protein